ncbi:MAG TPA: TonB-dependent receptor [Hyphomicrobiales bacterium]|nr:TonB-dependent receptor [Hyphomicrobiales bacterium]
MFFNRQAPAFAVKLTLASAIAAAPALALAQSRPAPPADESIPVIVVTALVVDENADKIVAPFSILDNEKLFERGGTLGDLLNGLPGVHADSFGGGASRPVLRGQGAPRVKVMSDSSALLDASELSPDHAITADPLLANRVEVLRGPATLLYGGGAIGGVVNVLDDKIPTFVPEDGLDGFVSLRGNTVASEEAAAASFTGRLADNFAVHAEGSWRNVDDYKSKAWDEPRVDGTAAENTNTSVGASWVGERGYLGLAYSYRSDDYGLPGHNHEYEGCHPHDATLHCGSHEEEDEHDHDHDHDHEHEHEAPVVDLDSRRVDLRGEYRDPFAGIHRIRLRASHTDYEHHELEEGEIATTFRNKGYEGRIELDHAPLWGWHGVVGGQLADTEFSALGEEAFVPRTQSDLWGLFAVEHLELNDNWHLEAGARYERQRHKPIDDPRGRPAFDGSATSFSAALIWAIDDAHTLAITAARAQRLPQPQELYARGIHIASNTYECGAIAHPLTCGGLDNNAPLSKESSNNIDIALRKHSGDLTYSLNVFHNQVDDYFYARTLDRYEDFRLIKYTQQDAEFTGAEAEVGYRFTDNFAASVFADYVRARFDDGGNLPRISPLRAGTRLNLELQNGVGAELEYFHVATQHDIADYETATPGYDMLNLSLAFDLFDDARYQLFLRASNLLDEEVWSHSSFLASVVPLPGRNLSMGVKVNF